MAGGSCRTCSISRCQRSKAGVEFNALCSEQADKRFRARSRNGLVVAPLILEKATV